jgi:hypothetical protein
MLLRVTPALTCAMMARHIFACGSHEHLAYEAALPHE